MGRPTTASVVTVILFASMVAATGGRQPAPGHALTLVTVDGRQTVLAKMPSAVHAPRVSLDGTRVAFDMRDPAGGGARVWVASLSDLEARRSLPGSDGLPDSAPLWTRDGERLLFLRSGGRTDALFWQRADGGDGAQMLVEAAGAEGWNPDGTVLRVLTHAGGGDYGLSLLDVSSRVLTPLVDIPRSAQHSSALSPDGRWLAYASNETGRYEVWLEPVPRTTVRYRITSAGGSHPLWSNDGRSIYFDRSRQLFQVMLDLDGPAPVGEPKALPISGFVQGELRRQYDLMPNGREFLLLMPLAAN